jgi:hypothetical protein
MFCEVWFDVTRWYRVTRFRAFGAFRAFSTTDFEKTRHVN